MSNEVALTPRLLTIMAAYAVAHAKFTLDDRDPLEERAAAREGAGRSPSGLLDSSA
jgi:hypothetical protein